MVSPKVSRPQSSNSLPRVSPLAVPVLLEIGKEQVYGSALDTLLEENAQALIEEAKGGPSTSQAELPL